MFNLCLLQRGRKTECLNRREVCTKQIANLESEIKLLQDHNLNKKLENKMSFMVKQLKRYVSECDAEKKN